MSKSLPQYVNPWLLFRHHEAVSGNLSLSEMPNLQSLQNRQDSEAQVQFEVNQRDDGKTVLVGEASIALTLDCQRCLQPLNEVFTAVFELVLVKFERQLESVNETDDALVVEDELILAPLIEQELILALPMIAKHEDCEANYDTPQIADEAERQQPFANLKDLLN